MQNKDKYTQLRDNSTEDERTYASFDPMALMESVAQQEAEASTGEVLLCGGQTLYAPSEVHAGKLKRTRPDGVIDEGIFSDGKFCPVR